ncbi:MAG: hypothetical protein FWE82_10250, partial [Defluviitaleaceae bacterium]|nr:hypothetical protein [Defluviitaleaceae bacterium]
GKFEVTYSATGPVEPPDLTAVYNDFKTEVLGYIYNAANNAVSFIDNDYYDGLINGLPVSIEVLGANESNIIISHEIVRYGTEFKNGDVIIGYSDWAVLFETEILTPIGIAATSGGRTVTATIGTNKGMHTFVDSTVEGLKFEPAFNGGAIFNNASADNPIYQGKDPVKMAEDYDKLITGLGKLVDRINSIGDPYTDFFGIPQNSPLWPASNITQNNHTLSAASGSHVRYINQSSTLTLSGNYANLEYLYVNGNLILNGNCTFPKLKKVYVSGIVSTNGNGTIAGRTRQNEDDDDYGTDFLIRGRNHSPFGTSSSQNNYDLFISGTWRINWCRFYVQGGSIGFGAGTYNTNSIFLATKGAAPLQGNAGQVHIGTRFDHSHNMQASTQLGQFLAESDLKISVHPDNKSSPQGIFVTASNTPIFWGNGAADSTIYISGLIVGNCNSYPTNGNRDVFGINSYPVRETTGVRMLSYNVAGIDPTDVMDGGLFGEVQEALINDQIGEDDPDTKLLSMSEISSLQFTGLSIAETTGGN